MGDKRVLVVLSDASCLKPTWLHCCHAFAPVVTKGSEQMARDCPGVAVGGGDIPTAKQGGDSGSDSPLGTPQLGWRSEHFVLAWLLKSVFSL